MDAFRRFFRRIRRRFRRPATKSATASACGDIFFEDGRIFSPGGKTSSPVNNKSSPSEEVDFGEDGDVSSTTTFSRELLAPFSYDLSSQDDIDSISSTSSTFRPSDSAERSSSPAASSPSVAFSSPRGLPVSADKLDEVEYERRNDIISVLEAHNVLSLSLADQVAERPFDLTEPDGNSSFVLLNNYLWLPTELGLSPCFMDYINFRCGHGLILDAVLRRRVEVAFNDLESIGFVLDKHAAVSELLGETCDGVFYSFCLGRAVSSDDTIHCWKCHVCYDQNFWHCDECNKCSYGLSYGTCEHCGYQDEERLSQFRFSQTESFGESVHSLSQLKDLLTSDDGADESSDP